MAHREKTRYPGVYGRAGRSPRHENDTCYDITYARGGKKVWEKVGWVSEGYSARVASHIRLQRMRSMPHEFELPRDRPKVLFMDAARKHLKRRKADKTRRRFLSVREADRLLRALRAKSRLVHDMALLSLHSGMRLNEIAGLRMSDIDLANGTITIHGSPNGNSRTAYMTGPVKAMIVSRISSRDDKSYDLVFPDERGRHAGSVSKTFLREVDSLRLNTGMKDPGQKITFSSLRHTFASWSALQGETEQSVSDLRGHPTMRGSHPTPEHRSTAAMEMLDESIG